MEETACASEPSQEDGVSSMPMLLAERFAGLVCYVQTKEFKPPKANQLAHVSWQAAAALSEGVGQQNGYPTTEWGKDPGRMKWTFPRCRE